MFLQGSNYALTKVAKLRKLAFNLEDARKASTNIRGLVRRAVGMDLGKLMQGTKPSSTGSVSGNPAIKIMPRRHSPVNITDMYSFQNRGPVVPIAYKNPELQSIQAFGPKSGIPPRTILAEGDTTKALAPNLKPRDKEISNRLMLLHERFERDALRKYKGRTSAGAHADPEVILRESNAIATMPKEHSAVQDLYSSLRQMDGSAPTLSMGIPGFEYGKQRLSRHAIKRMRQILEEKGLGSLNEEQLLAALKGQ